MLAVLAMFLAVGCGQRGPLFLPEPTPIEIGDDMQAENNDDNSEAERAP